MGWRFRKRIKIIPGIHINISKSGISANVGVKGANVTLGPKGSYVNTGIPGTGLYRRDKISGSKTHVKHNDSIVGNQNNTVNKESDVPSSSISRQKVRDNMKNDSGISTATVQKQTEEIVSQHQEEVFEPYNPRSVLLGYHYPTLDLLDNDNISRPYIDMEEQNAKKNIIVGTLSSFGVQLSAIKATVGPRITLYEIKLAPGVNISKIRGLEDDIALALCSYKVRIIIPIPGKGTIGIEVPNERRTILSLRNVLNTRAFACNEMDLPCAIGMTITNEPFIFDLTKAPHVLIAGSTGQGKSIALNAMIISLLYKKHPAELKIVLMDPYGVEFSIYAQIANHFLASLPDESVVVTNSSKAVSTLASLCKEMETRHDLLNKANVRNINDYNNKLISRELNPAGGYKYLPYIVVIIDEYGIFIEEKGQDFETPIVRLAQNARTVGIHLIISTKRPTNDIITGAIKANIPTRISFRVPERVDSQVILDCDGAEDLLGDGDMLYRGSKSIDCMRIQGAFVDTSIIERVNQYISTQRGFTHAFELPDPYYEEERNINDVDMQLLDPLFEDAACAIVLTQQGSTSMIQRRFAIGYNRASRLMDQLEKAGIVRYHQGIAYREVLINDEESLYDLLNSIKR